MTPGHVLLMIWHLNFGLWRSLGARWPAVRYGLTSRPAAPRKGCLGVHAGQKLPWLRVLTEPHRNMDVR